MIWKTLSENKVGVGFLAAALLSVIILFAGQGCLNAEKYVKVDVPARIQADAQVEPRITLAEAVPVFEDWQMVVERDGKRFASNIEDAQETVGVINSLLAITVDTATEAASGGIPIGGIFSSILLALGTYFLKRPGTDKAVAIEKEASYNAGLNKAADVIYAPEQPVVVKPDPQTQIQDTLELILVKALETLATKATDQIDKL